MPSSITSMRKHFDIGASTRWGMVVALLSGMLSSGCKGPENVEIIKLEPSVSRPPALDVQRSEARVFLSGHSLIDQPVPDDLQMIASSLGTPIEWNRQYIVGSSILKRSRGSHESSAWDGYKDGLNREGERMDVRQEFLRPQTIRGGQYDVLVITEQHSLLETLMWNDTVRYLRHYHDRFIDGNANGTTYFYEPWLEIADKNHPASWMEYETDASRIWQCMATRINVSLANEGRHDRLVAIPAGLSLVHLVKRATDQTLPAITGDTVRQTMDSIFADGVHLTPLGAYYVSLVTYSSIFRRSPVGASFPSNVSADQARVLQELADEFVRGYYEQYRPLSLQQCRQVLVDGTIEHFWTYVRDARWRQEMGSFRAYVRWLQMRVQSRYFLTRNDHRNAFYFDPRDDHEYWLSDW